MSGRLLDMAAVRALEPPEPLVDGWLNRDTLAMLYGPSGVGKSFVALDLALSVATGTPWHGVLVEEGPVVYVAAEGVSGMGRRIDAWCEHHGAYDPHRHHPIWWYPEAVNVGDPSLAATLGDVARDAGAVLVVVDTLARCTLGVEENSAKDIGMVIDNLDRIRRTSRACVLAVHHTGVADQSRGRGSSALKGAMDTELRLRGDDTCVKLENPKQKDGPEMLPLHLVLQPVAMDEESSCVLVPVESAATASRDELTRGALATLDALRTIQVPGGVTAGEWEHATAASRRSFYNHRARLVALGLARNVGTDARPRYVTADSAPES